MLSNLIAATLLEGDPLERAVPDNLVRKDQQQNEAGQNDQAEHDAGTPTLRTDAPTYSKYPIPSDQSGQE